MMELKASKILNIRFSEVDSMNVVWHGSYPLYFEDARELFGEKYDLTYMGFLIMDILLHWWNLVSSTRSPFAMALIHALKSHIDPRKQQRLYLTTEYMIQKTTLS